MGMRDAYSAKLDGGYNAGPEKKSTKSLATIRPQICEDWQSVDVHAILIT